MRKSIDTGARRSKRWCLTNATTAEKGAQAPAHTNKGRAHQSQVRRNTAAVGRRAGEGNRLLLCFLHLNALPNCHSGQKWQCNCSQLFPANPSAASLKGANMTSRSTRMPASFQVANVIRKGLLLCTCFCLSGWNMPLCVPVMRAEPWGNKHWYCGFFSCCCCWLQKIKLSPFKR